MRIVVQRVSEAAVEVDGENIASIGRGIVILAAFRKGDTEKELDWIARKVLEMRIFEDDEGKMNRSLIEVSGDVLVVSQFTLYGNCDKGRRPDYTSSASSSEAMILYRKFIEIIGGYYPRVSEGEFGAHMKVRIVNDGPVTLLLDRESKRL